MGYGLQGTRLLKGAHNHEMHCSYLVLLFETGVIGLFLGLLMMYLALRRVQIVLKSGANSVETLVLYSLLIGLASLALYNVFTNGLRQREMWILFGVLLSLSYVGESVSERNDSDTNLNDYIIVRG
jgi:O-antigen ligase